MCVKNFLKQILVFTIILYWIINILIFDINVFAKANSFQIGDNVYVDIEDGKATIYGTGSTWDFYSDGKDISGTYSNPFYSNRVTSIEINEDIDYLGDYLFYYQQKAGVNSWYIGQADLTEIKLPSTLKGFGKYVFENCSKISKVSIPDGVTVISEGLFDQCTMLKEVELPKNLKMIKKYAFNMSGLESIIIPEGVEKIDAGAFSSCLNLKSVTLPSTITGIEEMTFFSCQKLENVNIPSNTTYIGNQAFAYCYKLENIEIPKKVEEIGYNAFWNCQNIKNIVLPPNLKKLESAIFAGCSMLQKLIIPENVTTIGDECFTACVRLKELYISKNVYSISDNAFISDDSIVIYAPEDSFAKYYAESKEIEYKEICSVKNIDGIPTVNVDCVWDEGFVSKESTPTENGELTYTCKNCGKTKKEVIEKTKCTLSGKIKSFEDSTAEIIVELYGENSDERIDSKSLYGNDISYQFQNIPAGNYIIKVFKEKHSNKELSITIDNENQVENIILYLIGDINEDSKINQKDAKLVLKAFAGKEELTDTQKNAADVNNDGKINQKDAKLILKYYAGKIDEF